MKASRRQEINEFADLIRSSCNLPLPVKEKGIVEVIKNLGGRIAPHNDGDFEAKIEKIDDDSFQIVIGKADTNSNPRRKLFTLAHELGHLFLHMGYIVDPDTWKNAPTYEDGALYRYGHSVEEHEASEFAAAFLMPQNEFSIKVREAATSGRVNMAPIAEYFGVSFDAAVTRGKWLGLLSWD
jgi:Zn-dependent peptidase ImmA (M78 family)